MAQGWSQTEAATQAAQQARERINNSRLPQLTTAAVQAAKGGQPQLARFLEQGDSVHSFHVHEYNVPSNTGGQSWRRQFTCANQDPWWSECRGCQAGLKRKLRGVFNVIWRSAPVYRKDAEGNRQKVGNDFIIDGYLDQVVILSVPSTTSEELRKKDAEYHGLMSRDVILAESGNTFQPWSISLANIDGGPQPFTENDQALAAKKHDLNAFMKPPAVQEQQQIITQYGPNSGVSPNASGGFASPQGNAAQAGSAGGFLAGAQLPQQGQGMPPAPPQAPAPMPVPGGGAFGAAQQPVPAPVQVPVPAQQVAPAPVPAPVQQPPVAPVPQPVPAPVQQ